MSKALRRDELIKALIDLGYGNSKEEVLEYLLQRSIDDILRTGIVRLGPNR